MPPQYSALALTLIISAGVAAQPAAGPSREGALRVERVEFVDRQGFEKPLVAATILIPAGWRSQAGVEWNIRQTCGAAQGLRLAASAPDDSERIELLPGEAWAASNQGRPVGDCAPARFRDAREYLAAWAQRHRPGAAWLEYQPRLDKSQAPVQSQSAGSGIRQWSDAGQALIAYSRGGVETHETLVAVVWFTESQFAGLQPGQALHMLHGQSRGVLAWRAAKGRLDMRQFNAVWDSYRLNPEWRSRITAGNNQMASDNAQTQARVSQIHAETARQTLAEVAKRGANRARTQAELADIQAGIHRDRDASTDRMQNERVKAIREVQTYVEPRSGKVIELPSHYAHAWRLKDGSYLLTDNPNFKPLRDLGLDGDALARMR